MTARSTSQLQEFTKDQLITLIIELYEKITLLEFEIQSLKKNSSNSSKPPSSDFPIKRNQSLREKSGKPSGGQIGHPGTTRTQVEHPDIAIPCKPSHCERCGIELSNIPGTLIGKRQEADIPPIKAVVTEYQQEEIICPCCGKRNMGTFPEGINAQFQIGDNLKSFVVYLNVAHHVPFERLTNLLSDLLSFRVSEGTVDNVLDDAEVAGTPLSLGILNLIKQYSWTGSDESGVRVEGKTWWQWTWQNLKGTYYAIEPSRGYDVIKLHFGEDYNGDLLHDCWGAQNNTHARRHQLCHPHLLRDLQFCIDAEGSRWARNMTDFLLESERIRDALWVEGYDSKQRERTIRSYHRRFEQLIGGRIKGIESQTLQKRFQKHHDKILTFLSDPDLPFHNNSSEQAIRNAKLHKKISGGFRSERGARRHAVLLSIIETCKKRKMDILQSLKQLFQGTLAFSAC